MLNTILSYMERYRIGHSVAALPIVRLLVRTCYLNLGTYMGRYMKNQCSVN